MDSRNITIAAYSAADHAVLLRLLLELHNTYFHQHATAQIQELRREQHIEKSYDDYLHMLDEHTGGTWYALMAKTAANENVGFIIGSLETDESLALGKMGRFEDWYVIPGYRGCGIGMRLYTELEKWFRGKGCQQVVSDTWHENEPSIKAHLKAGFFVSGIMFGKKL